MLTHEPARRHTSLTPAHTMGLTSASQETRPPRRSSQNLPIFSEMAILSLSASLWARALNVSCLLWHESSCATPASPELRSNPSLCHHHHPQKSLVENQHQAAMVSKDPQLRLLMNLIPPTRASILTSRRSPRLPPAPNPRRHRSIPAHLGMQLMSLNDFCPLLSLLPTAVPRGCLPSLKSLSDHSRASRPSYLGLNWMPLIPPCPSPQSAGNPAL